MSSPYLKGFPTRYRVGDLAECQGDGWIKHFWGAKAIVDAGGIAVFLGAPGTGKTRMATEIAAKMQPRIIKVSQMSQSMPCRYYTSERMLAALKDSFSNAPDAKSEAAHLDLMADATLLVIDEIDSGIRTDFGQRKFKIVVDERYQRKLPTILITNYGKADVGKLFPPQVLDRIREDGKGFLFDWPSFRVNNVDEPKQTVLA